MKSHQTWGGAPWKCRAVENEENQNQVSLRFPTALGNRSAISTFPPRRLLLIIITKNQRKEPNHSPLPAFTPSGPFLD